jgi:hypothetical protein
MEGGSVKIKAGDLVQVILESSVYFGQVGVVSQRCMCPSALATRMMFGHRVFCVTLERDTCFVESALKKLGGRPAPSVNETGKPKEVEA